MDGHNLAASANLLAVWVNIARTHLQRIFDRTGACSQTMLVRAFLDLDKLNKWCR
jgi:DNA-binding CsgD family transcriptional regulator